MARWTIDEHTPVPHLSYFEADAYARWAGARLPTEAEWEHAARHFEVSPHKGHFAQRGVFHPMPAEHAAAAKPLQMFGDVWEWTQSPYAPYPGFQRGRWRGGRVQRQVHVQPVRAARRLVRDAGDARSRQLPQLLPARRAVAVQRAAPGA